MSILPSIVPSSHKSGDAGIFIPLVQKLESKTPRPNNQVNLLFFYIFINSEFNSLIKRFSNFQKY